MGLDYDPRAKKFIEEHPKLALALATTPYAGMGVGLLGETVVGGAARLFPAIAAETGGGGSSIFGGYQLANAGSRFFMTEAAGFGSNVGRQIPSILSESAAVAAQNPNLAHLGFGAMAAGTATAIIANNPDTIQDINNLLGSSTPTARVEPSSQQSVPQAVKVWDVNKPLPVNINPCAIIDQDANKPTILITPIPSEKPVTILSTSDQRNILQKLGALPGFDPAPSELTGGLVESFPDHSDLADSMSILYKKQYPDSVEKINERFPINADLAGQKYPLNKLPEHIQAKYPDSVMVDERGFMRFEPYTYIDDLGRIHRIESDNLTGDNFKDSNTANKIMGIEKTPDGYTWHHVEDGQTMIAIPTDLHDLIKHTGGGARIKERSKYAK